MLYPLSVVKTQQMALANAPRGLRVRAPPAPAPLLGLPTSSCQLVTRRRRPQPPRIFASSRHGRRRCTSSSSLARDHFTYWHSSVWSLLRQACIPLCSLLQLKLRRPQ